MKVLILYATTHNCTVRVVEKIKQELNASVTCVNVEYISSTRINFSDFYCVIFCSPTYGCEDVHESMESFLVQYKEDLHFLNVIIVETGNYYGYDDFTFGAKSIITKQLVEYKCKFIYTGLSLDTFPRVDWNHLSNWVKYINQCLTLE